MLSQSFLSRFSTSYLSSWHRYKIPSMDFNELNDNIKFLFVHKICLCMNSYLKTLRILSGKRIYYTILIPSGFYGVRWGLTPGQVGAAWQEVGCPSLTHSQGWGGTLIPSPAPLVRPNIPSFFPPTSSQPSKLPFAPSFSPPRLSHPPGSRRGLLAQPAQSRPSFSVAQQPRWSPPSPCADPRALAAPLPKPPLGRLGCHLPVLLLPGYGSNYNDIFSWWTLPRPFWSWPVCAYSGWHGRRRKDKSKEEFCSPLAMVGGIGSCLLEALQRAHWPCSFSLGVSEGYNLLDSCNTLRGITCLKKRGWGGRLIMISLVSEKLECCMLWLGSCSHELQLVFWSFFSSQFFSNPGCNRDVSVKKQTWSLPWIASWLIWFQDFIPTCLTPMKAEGEFTKMSFGWIERERL